MKLLFAYENPLPNAEADAEVFVTTAKYLAPHFPGSRLHAPLAAGARHDHVETLAGVALVAAKAPLRPAGLRHILCGLTIVCRRAFREADVVYTRNLWVAWMSILFGQRVVFDHYRPWPDQIPPLQHWIYRLFCHRRFLGSVCHSEYTRSIYQALGVPTEKLRCIHNGFEPNRFRARIPLAEAKQSIGLPASSRTVVYTGRVNHKKGLELVIEAAKQLPDLTFLFVGSYGEGPVERLARAAPNIRIIPWQTEATLANYIFAADVLLIPPSLQPLEKFGSTVLPLKLFFYLGSGRPILAGNTPDVAEVLRHGQTAWLCTPDSLSALVEGLRALTEDQSLAARLGDGARDDSRNFTWAARADKIAEAVQGWAVAAPRRGVWRRGQSAIWARQSWRWLVHFARTRSPILPSGRLPPAS
jgi:glycosyltransferase involved in cell wall biosynthesis